MTRRQYAARWRDPKYVSRVEWLSLFIDSDGCTGVPDFYLLGCKEHDIAYCLWKDPCGTPISQKTADKRLRWYIQMRSPFGRLSPMSWWRWAAVRLFGKKLWHQEGRPKPFPKRSQ